MARRFLKRYLPNHQSIREHRHLRFLGKRLHDPNLWHLNRRSVAGAMGVGVVVAFIPLPGQVIIAAFAAIWLRINLPLTVTTVFITNPFTMPPVFYFTYKVGVWMLGTPPQPFAFELSLHWLWHKAGAIWAPLLIGSLTVGVLLGTTVYGVVRLLWRLQVIRRRRKPNKSTSRF
jgi:uncharacterized protein (DUF2062 family)